MVQQEQLSNQQVVVYDFGLTEYSVIWQLQKDLVEKQNAGEMPSVLLVGQHPDVITVGRGGREENIVAPDVPVLEIERGGDVTYHGPGQLIAYPIIALENQDRDLHAYLRKLEEVLILTLKDFGVWGLRNPGYTGVWVINSQTRSFQKVASVGVAVKKWITYHGIALNVNTNLDRFAQINPCGLQSDVMTSLTRLLQRPVKLSDVQMRLIANFMGVFNMEKVSEKTDIEILTRQ